MDYAKESLRLHGEWKGKIEVVATVPVASKDDLSLAYTPGVAQPCIEINKDVNKSTECVVKRKHVYHSRRCRGYLKSIVLCTHYVGKRKHNTL